MLASGITTRKVVLIEKLKNATYNPPLRIEDINLQGLIKSIEQIGLQYPIIITRDYMIIDGHRRVAACKVLGYKKIECMVSDKSPDEVYRSIEQRPFSGNDLLGIWLRRPDAVSKHQRAFEKMERVIGRPLMQRMYKAGLSKDPYTLARKLVKRCPEMDVTKTIAWFLDHDIVLGQVKKAVENRHCDLKPLVRFIKNNEPAETIPMWTRRKSGAKS